MDRIALILLLLFAPGVLAQNDWGGRFEILPNTWRGTIEENRQPFGTILDDGADNGKISFLADPVSDRRLAGYKIYYGTETGVYTMTHDCKRTLETGCTISGLTNETTYYFVSVAYGLNPAITSEYSTEISGTP
jgi:hypothetical protein